MLALLFLTKFARGAPHLRWQSNHAATIGSILGRSSWTESGQNGVRILMLTGYPQFGHDSAAFSEGGPRIDPQMSEELALTGWPKSPFIAS